MEVPPKELIKKRSNHDIKDILSKPLVTQHYKEKDIDFVFVSSAVYHFRRFIKNKFPNVDI